MKNQIKLALLALIVYFAAVPAPVLGSVITLRFDEIASTPADGLTGPGIAFHFSFGGTPSQDAIYGAPFPSDQLLQDFVLAGPAQNLSDPSQSGILTFTFAQPTHVLNFALALSTTADDIVSLILYDALGNAMSPVTIATTYDHGNCDPGTQTCLSEAEYTYPGDGAISQVSINFDGTNADSFAIDNLEFDLPEPSSFSMLALAGAIMLGVLARRNAVSVDGKAKRHSGSV